MISLVVTVGLWLVTRRQAEISDRQADISKAHGVAAMRIERASIEVKLPELLMSSFSRQSGADPAFHSDALVRLSISNAGNTPAVVSGVSVTVSFVEGAVPG